MINEIQRLETEIATLGAAITTLAGMPSAQAPLQTQLAEKHAALAALRDGATLPTAAGGNTTTIHGGVQGNVLSGTFTGPVDVCATTVNQGPVVSGPIQAGQNVNIAKEQTITNNQAPGSVTITGGTVKGPVVGTNSGRISASYGDDEGKK